MLEGPFATFTLTLVVGVILSFLSWLIARRSGLLPLQSNLVDTLQDTVEALEKQLSIAEADRDKAAMLAEERRLHVERLEDSIVGLVNENAALRRKTGAPPRRRTATEREAMDR